MKQTAVEWLHQKLATSSQEELVGNINIWFMEAKAIEKEQIIDFAKICLDKALDLDVRTAYSQIERYYTSTYNK